MPEWRELIAMQRERLRDLYQRAVGAVEQLGDEDVNWRPNAESNSIANLAAHLLGNARQRFLSFIGGAPDTRDRDAEFDDRLVMTREQVLDTLAGWYRTADGVMAELTPERLDAPVPVGGREMSVLAVVLGAIGHYAEHVGQIMYIAKLRLGPRYRVLSVPHRRR